MTGLRPDGLRDDRGDQRRDGARAARSPRTSTTSTRTARGPSRTTATRRRRYKQTLGEHAYKIPISSIKSMIGHSLGAIGAIEMAACALAIDRGVVPPTANWENPRPRVRPRLHARTRRAHSAVRRGALDRQRLRRLPVGDDLRAFPRSCGRSRREPDDPRGAPEPACGARRHRAGPPAWRRVHRHRRRRPERHRTRRPGGRPPRRARAGSTASPTSIPPSTPPSSPARSRASTPTTTSSGGCQVQTDRWTHMALAATQMAFDDAELRPFAATTRTR